MQCTNSCGLDGGCKNPYLFYDGPENPKILVIGEAPGRDEDEKCRLFIGRSGSLLREGLSQLGFDLDTEVGFCNTCSCRPPENRTPTKKEIKTCLPNLLKTIESVSSSVKMVFLMGNTPMSTLLGRSGITKTHGIPEYIEGVPYFPMYHPAYILRNEGTSIVDTFFDDLEKAGRLYDNIQGTRVKTWSHKELNAEELEKLMPEILKAELLSFDTETNTLDMYEENADIICLGFCFDGNNGYLIPLWHPDLKIEPIELKKRIALMKQILESKIPKITQNGMYDIRMVDKVFGIKVNNLKHDTTLMSHLLDENSPHNLTYLTNRYNPDMSGYDDAMEGEKKKANGRMDKIPYSFIPEYCCGDAVTTYRVCKTMLPLLEEEKLTDLYYNVVMTAYRYYIEIADRGIKIDTSYVSWLQKEYAERLVVLRDEIHTLPLCQKWEAKNGSKVNFNSPAQMQELIYEMGGAPVQIQKKTKKPSLDSLSREKLLELPMNPKYEEAIAVVQKLEDLSKVQKLDSMFVQKAFTWLRDDGYIHPNFLVHGTVTGRLSCVPLDSEILTRSGWKTHNCISIGDEVLGFDIQKWQYRWTKLVGISRGIDLVGKTYYGTCHDKKYCSHFLSTGNHKWISRYKDLVGFAESSSRLRGIRQVFQPTVKFPDCENSILSPEEAFLLGWYLTDGFKTGEVNYGLSMQLTKVRSVELLKRYLDKYKIPYTNNRYKHKSGFKKEDGHYITEFHISPSIFNKIYTIYYSMEPSKLIVSLSEEARESMFLAMLEGDGSMRRNKKHYDRFGALEEQKKRTPEVFEILSLSLGKPYSYRFSTTLARKKFVNYGLLGRELVDNKDLRWEPTEEVEVWCPQTELGTWVMRQGHGICITGNCTAPNAQQLPKATPTDTWLKEHPVKRMFVSKYEDGYLVSADYSQLELRLMACISGDSLMIETYRNNGDIHATTARRMFPDYDTVDDATRDSYRSQGKTKNFSSVYSLAEDYLKIYPGLKSYAKKTEEECKKYGYVVNEFGRRRRLPNIRSFDRTEYYHAYLQACNSKIQSLGHELIEISIARISKRLRKENLESHIVLEVHDSIVVDAPNEEEAKKVAIIMKEEMEDVKYHWAVIPIKVDVKYGKNLQDMDKEA